MMSPRGVLHYAPTVPAALMTDLPLAVGSLPFVGELAALFAAGVLVAYLCYRVRLVPIAGFLLAGVAIGPYALGLVTDVELVAELAEVGVILLLFSIGVEFAAKIAIVLAFVPVLATTGFFRSKERTWAAKRVRSWLAAVGVRKT